MCNGRAHSKQPDCSAEINNSSIIASQKMLFHVSEKVKAK